MGSTQTRDCIDEALVDLMSEKELSRISVIELINGAGVSRTTFYRYYESIPQMAEEITNRFIEGARAASSHYVADRVDFDDIATPRPSFVSALAYVYGRRRLFLAFTGPHGDPAFTKLFVDLVREFYGARLAYEGRVREDFDMRMEFVLAGCPGMLRYWLEGRPDLTPEEVASILQRLIFSPYALEEYHKMNRRSHR